MAEPTNLCALAPEPFTAWATAVGTLPSASPHSRALAATVADRLAATPADVPGPVADSAAAVPAPKFVEQFVVDVSGITTAMRSEAFAILGPDAFTTVQVLYVLDLGTRMNAAFRQLFGAPPEVGGVESADLWTTLEQFMPAVARLTALDPLTTDLVRLRGARAHDCRLCQSLRNVHAARTFGDDTRFDQVDDFESSDLTERQKTALRLVDAMIWQPVTWPDGLADQLRDAYSAAELVELVLDIVRNSANKIAVAFGADDPHVTKGVEYYDTDANGDLVYGLTL